MTPVDLGGVVLGVTPGWAACGWALVRLERSGETVLQAGVIRMRDAYRATEVTGSDVVRRGRMLVGQLRVVARREPLVAVVRRALDDAEPLDHRAYGALDSIADELDVPTYETRASASSLDLITGRLGQAELDRLFVELVEDEVPVVQRARAIEAVALVLTAAAREIVIAESRSLIRRRGAGGKT